MNASEIESIVADVLARLSTASLFEEGDRRAAAGCRVPIEASARHIHVNAAAVEQLFGAGAKLRKKRDLSQQGEFLAEQRVKLVTSAGEIADAAVLGPLRQNVQTELSATDCRLLGLRPPVNVSGDLTGAADVFIVGERGMIEAKGSVIIAKSHVHLPPADAAAYGLTNGGRVGVRVESKRPVTFDDVVVRVSDAFSPAVHIDFDEANACMLDSESRAYLLCGEGNAVTEIHAENVCAAPQEPAVCEDEKVITEAVARRIVAAAKDDDIPMSRRTIITPSAMDIFRAARKTVRRI